MGVSVEDVKAYRERFGVGLQDARRILEKEDRDGRLLSINYELSQGYKSLPQALSELIAIMIEMNDARP